MSLERLKEIQEEIKELADEAIDIIEKEGHRRTYRSALAYWYPHLIIALGDLDGEYATFSQHSLNDSIKEMQEENTERPVARKKRKLKKT